MKDLYKDLRNIKKRYEKGENILEYIKGQGGVTTNSVDAIMVSYDIQSGTYTEKFDESSKKKVAYCEELVRRLEQLDSFKTFLLVGVGEGITFGNVLSRLKQKPEKSFGFDISWSRIKYAKKFVARFDVGNAHLTTGNIFETPFLDNSIELVMSNHSLEPNGGREEEALKELYRISSKYIVINEPCYELAPTEAKERIERHGYVKNLHLVAQKLGYNIISHELFDNPTNKLNPTSCLVIKKEEVLEKPSSILACPITNHALIQQDDCFFCPDSLLIYPIIQGIPCLLSQNAIMASHYEI